MSTFSVAEAKNNLSKLIDLALQGETVTITRHGAPVVELRPAKKAPSPVTAEALAQLRAARERLGQAALARVPLGPARGHGEDTGPLVARLREEEWEGR